MISLTKVNKKYRKFLLIYKGKLKEILRIKFLIFQEVKKGGKFVKILENFEVFFRKNFACYD